MSLRVGKVGVWILAFPLGFACTTLPTPSHTKHVFPNNAHIGDVKRPYEVLGLVKTRVEFQTLDPTREEKDLCNNYFNKAAEDLVKRAREKGGDAVLDVKSVVYLVDGRQEFYPTAECSDDGQEGQVLAQGVVVKWKPEPPAPAASPIVAPLVFSSPLPAR
ncbi:hypothetical protein WDW86_15285 [Bdellovibrionota bacterium FG-2]